MAKNYGSIAATPEVIDTLRKARQFVNNTGKLQGNNLTDNYQNIPTDQNNYQQPQGVIPAKVVSGNGIVGYTCNLYANGLTETPTGQGLVFLANGASTFYALPAGTVLFVQAVSISIMGTND